MFNRCKFYAYDCSIIITCVLFRERTRRVRRWQQPLWPLRSLSLRGLSTPSSRNELVTSALVKTSSRREISAALSNGPNTSGSRGKRLFSRPVSRSPRQSTSSTRPSTGKQVGSLEVQLQDYECLFSLNRLWRAQALVQTRAMMSIYNLQLSRFLRPSVASKSMTSLQLYKRFVRHFVAVGVSFVSHIFLDYTFKFLNASSVIHLQWSTSDTQTIGNPNLSHW